MAEYRVAVMTDAGINLLADSIVKGYKIEFVKMVIGSGEYSEEEKKTTALRQHTSLKEKQQEFGFSSVKSTEESEILLKAVISNAALDTGYYMREIGIIAKKEGDTDEILYSIAIAEVPDFLPGKENPTEVIQEYYTKVNNASDVTISVNQGAYATAEDVDEIRKTIYAHENSKINSEEGVHGVRYFNGKWQVLGGDEGSEWKEASSGAGAYIIISTSTESFIGKTVTATSTLETVTGVFGDDGTCKLTVKYLDTYTIECEEYSITVDVKALGAVYNAEINEHYSTINVTTSTLSGYDISVLLNGSVCKTATFSESGNASITVFETGTYTLRTVYDGVIFETTVEVTEMDTSYNTTLDEHHATIAITTTTEEWYSTAVELYKDDVLINSGTFSVLGTAEFVVYETGTYVIKSNEKEKSVTVEEMDSVYSVKINALDLVRFDDADATWEQIIAMIEAHYNDEINLSDYWAVGDTRTVHLSAMEATGVGESHRAQTVQYRISDFEHYDLVTEINGHTKAAILIDQVNCLMDAACEAGSRYGTSNTERGYMNSSNTNSGGWRDCARRKWCNEVYLNAMPEILRNAVKEVKIKTSAGNTSTTIVETNDKIFLPSGVEIFGSTNYSVAGEGSQYAYYKNATANRYKLPKYSSSASDVSDRYWERSPKSGSMSDFCYVNNSGGENDVYASATHGIAPCLCI